MMLSKQLLLWVVAAFVKLELCVSFSKPFLMSPSPFLASKAVVPTTTTTTTTTTARFSENYEQSEGGEDLPPPPPPVQASGPPPVKPKRLDPLMASVTRMDPGTQEGKTTNIPLLGEVPVDGGLTVLVPAALIAVVGFIMSINIIANSQDAIVNGLAQISEEANKAAIERTNKVPEDNVCRGLCSNQDESYEGLKSFMQSLSKKTDAPSVVVPVETPSVVVPVETAVPVPTESVTTMTAEPEVLATESDTTMKAEPEVVVSE
mmetsp:Transcript_12815/g.19866  ORF Transcript_12815/g.19866 Transcript_12815/m.19866 type:complete len:262 (+) Transcript_12815:122-907(+)